MFKIQQGRDGLYYWHLQATNGEILCHSEGYSSYQGAQRGIEATCRVVSQVIR